MKTRMDQSLCSAAKTHGTRNLVMITSNIGAITTGGAWLVPPPNWFYEETEVLRGVLCFFAVCGLRW
jgi:hypothetical protein